MDFWEWKKVHGPGFRRRNDVNDPTPAINLKNSDGYPPAPTVPQTEQCIVDCNAWTTTVTRQVTDRTCGRPTKTRQNRQHTTQAETQ